MDPIITPAVLTFGVGFARAAIELMRVRQENALARENFINQDFIARREHDFQLRLQEVQHQHEILLAQIRSNNTDPNITIVVDANNSRRVPGVFIEDATSIPAYLNVEAELLCNKGFNVIADPINEGYALAVFVRTDFTVAFWLPSPYPHEPPTVYVITPLVMEHIPFEDGTWEANRNLIEVIDALAYSF